MFDAILILCGGGLLLGLAHLLCAAVQLVGERKQALEEIVEPIREVATARQPVKVVPLTKPETIERQTEGFDVQSLFGGPHQ